MLDIYNLEIKFGRNIILNKCRISLKKNCVTLITGESGSGKTTLLSYLSLNRTNDQEEYSIDGKKIDLNDFQAIQSVQQSKISYVFQDFELLNEYTILENLKIARSLSYQSEKVDYKNILKQVYLDDQPLNKKVSKLSGGQKQRLQIAMSILKDTPYLLMDEPTASLDEANTKIIVDIIDCLKESKGIIIVTHAPDVFNYDELYRIENKELILEKEYKADQNDEDDQVIYKSSHRLLFRLFWFKKLRNLIYILIAGIAIGECGYYISLGNGVYGSMKEELVLYDQDEVLIYESFTSSYADYGGGNPIIDEEILEKIESLDEVQEIYPYYNFISFGGTALNQYTGSVLDYGVELIYPDQTTSQTEISLNGTVYYDDGTVFHSKNQLIALDETKISDRVDQYQSDVQEGIYLTKEVADYLGITDISGLTIRFNVEVPVGTEYLESWYLGEEDQIFESRCSLNVITTLEYPVKGILLKNNSNLYGIGGSTPFYMDYHYMADIQVKTTNDESAALIEQYKTDYPENKNKIENGYLPQGYIVRLKDNSQYDSFEKELSSLSPTLDVDGYNKYQKEESDSVAQYRLKEIEITAALGAVIILLMVAVKNITLRTEEKEYSYYHVNGIHINRLYLEQSIGIEIISMIISFIFTAYKISLLDEYAIEYTSINWITVLCIVGIHMIIVFISFIFNKRILKTCNINRLIRKM